MSFINLTKLNHQKGLVSNFVKSINKTTKVVYSNSLKYSLDFEYTMALLFGDRTDQIASLASSEKYVKEWLRKAVKRLLKDTKLLDTTERHKEMIVMKLENIDKLLKEEGNLWDIIFDLFNLTSRLYGYDYHKSQKLTTPVYFQTPFQNFWSGLHKGEDWMRQKEKKENFISKRIRIMLQLKSEGYSDFEISQILNTTEYDIKKALREVKK